jgi:deoxyribonuclease-4
MLIGAHESIAGGLVNAVTRGVQDHCEVIQIFTGAPSRWQVPEIKPAAAQEFSRRLDDSSLVSFMVHGAYLVNPATPDPDLWQRSLGALEKEYERCRAIMAPYLIIHPGSACGSSPDEAIGRSARMIRSVLDKYPDGPDILIENTAGSGSTLAGTFSEVSEIMGLVDCGSRVGCCFDTAHAYAAGYDIREEDTLSESLGRMDSEMGLGHIKAVHLNDSARELGSRVDRHARIGEGLLGEEPFAVLLGRSEFADVPAVLETTPHAEEEGRYRPQVQLLKRLRKGGK